MLVADQATSHYRNQWWLVYIYASLSLNELTCLGHQRSTISKFPYDNISNISWYQITWQQQYSCIPYDNPHRGRGKMVTILKTTFQIRFPSVKISISWFKFHWFFFSRAQLNNCPELVQITARCRTGNNTIIWTIDDLLYWRMWASLGFLKMIYHHQEIA